jgi:hypothetical protein
MMSFLATTKSRPLAELPLAINSKAALAFLKDRNYCGHRILWQRTDWCCEVLS